MSWIHTHAARAFSAACVFTFLTGCEPSEVADRPADEPRLVFQDDTSSAAFGDVVLSPWSRSDLLALEASDPPREVWQRILGVRVGDTTGLPMLGTYSVARETLRFTPRFKPAKGTRFVARFDSRPIYVHIERDGPTRLVTTSWNYAGQNGPASTMVRAVYPTASDVPMNLLRMYVEFSAPMSTGRSYDYIELYTEGDSLIEEPFFTAGDAIELWDPAKTRLTILFDPGRIKRDLRPNQQLGLPLREGKRYRIAIDSAWPDAQGRPLLRRHEKRFRVHGMDRSLVRTAEWSVSPPRAGTRDSLVVVFPEALDRALLERLLVVRDASDVAVAGDVSVTALERRWAFAPRAPWSTSAHYIDVDTELEDLAGNNLRRLFDVAPSDTAALGVSGTKSRVPFALRPR